VIHRAYHAAMRRAIVLVLVVAGLSSTGPAGPARHPLPQRGPFAGTVHWIDAETRELMRGSSWRPGCPVRIRDLRLVRVTHWGFDDREHTGEVVVHERWAEEIVSVFRRLFAAHYTVRRLRLVDHYGGDDLASMKADNTSAFNCRWRAGSPGVWSEHAYGRAIDVNPVENPYVTADHVSPPAGAAYVDRTQDLPGMIHLRDPVWLAFQRIGWEWGGAWSSVKDYQHFSATGREARPASRGGSLSQTT
jgi:D-alanyl-D-alanine carboxypeptidase-like protein